MAGAAGADTRATLRWTLLLLGGWLLAAVLVNPIGDFPLDDDWSYGLTVRTLLTSHRLHLTDFTSMPLLPQVLWGWLFCLPAGFSFTALRVSTLVAAAGGLWLVFHLGRQLGLRPGPAALLAAVVGFNPLYFALSFSFMTDVPFTVLAVAAIAAFVTAWTRHRPGWFWTGVALTTLATLLRQLGLAVALGASLAESVRLGKVRARAWAPLAASLAALTLWTVALRLWVGLPAYYRAPEQLLLDQARLGVWSTLKRIAFTAGETFAYVGLFTLPIQRLLPPARLTAPSPRVATIARATAIAAGVASAATLVLRKAAMPLTGNILTNLTLYPVMMPGADHLPTAPLWVWRVLTAVAVVGGALLVERLVVGLSWLAPHRTDLLRPDPVVGLFLFGCGAWYLLPFLPMPSPGFYDRYFLPLIVIAALLAVWTASRVPHAASRSGVAAAAAAVALCVLFAVPAMHDTLALNRARWQAVHWATAEDGLPPRAVDGGFEVNGWYYFANGARLTAPTTAWHHPAHPQAIVALSPLAGYRAIRTFSFPRWLPPGAGRVYVLMRAATPAS